MYLCLVCAGKRDTEGDPAEADKTKRRDDIHTAEVGLPAVPLYISEVHLSLTSIDVSLLPH